MSAQSCGCSLSPPQLHARRESLARSLVPQIRESRELEEGLALGFSANDSIVDELAQFIDFERRCCSALEFKLIVGADKYLVWIEITG